MKKLNAVSINRKNEGKFKLVKVFTLLLIVLILSHCSKDSLIKDPGITTTLSTNSPDLQARLEAIKKSFYQEKLDEKIKPKKTDRLLWYPDWENPKIQVVNDSVSYVFYEFLGKVDGKNVNVKSTNGKLFLMVKNEKDFYKAFYYKDNDAQSDKGVKEFDMNQFTGNLLLSSLQNGQNYLLDYTNGHLSDSYLKKGVLAVKKLQSNKGIISYWQENCQSIVRNCTYSTLSVPPCAGGGIVVTFSADCQWPQAMCGYPFSLTDSDEAVVCENVWFPDPPDPGNGTGGGDSGEFSPVVIDPLITMEPTTRPCLESLKNGIVNAAQFSVTMANLLKQVNNDHTKAQNAVLALANNTDRTITIGEKNIPYETITNPDGSTIAKETHGETNPITGNIKLNTITMNEASDLAIAATLIHEMMHSYFVWGANNLSGEEAMAFSDLNRYLFSQETGAAYPYNYPELGAMQHMQMAETYVNSMANLLVNVATSKGIGTSPDTSISLEEYCRDIFWGSLQQTSGLDSPNAARSKSNSEREYKNQSGSTGKKECL
ncbi:hypothetical protein [Pedobacter sp. CFBP9032]|uniref:hypothetical protein n=1 Tax=Pedobacter sp. CFBP9032 TaxID=3096539 RepID=UPI002A69DEBE|nr:hypothetical protein [Pedobacter sp. CFBP9032]MDY0904437.1 hypothetical protein [Pedobacter sp. CFBP9032]